MYKIVKREELNSTVTSIDVLAPRIAKKAQPGQFIIFRVDENGERTPLTIADVDSEQGTVRVIFQIVGKSTSKLNELQEGECVHDFVGPLGKPSETEGLNKVAVIGGGVGCAIAYPVTKKLFEQGAQVDAIVGFRNKDLVILQKDFAENSSRLFTMTDDGSFGEQGFVTTKLAQLLDSGEKYDEVIAIGPLVMMRAVCELTAKHKIKTVVSMNPIMIDGTGMCGGCRLTVGGKVKFACVDGPEFDGHQVDFAEAIARSATYREQERSATHNCNLHKGGN